jgi:uncharacterized membrane protein
VAGCLLGILIIFNIGRFGPIEIRTLRLPTIIIYIALGIYFVSFGKAGIGKLKDIFNAVVGHRYFFRISSGAMLILYLISAIDQHLSFNTFSHDFSLFDDILYNTAHGRFMVSSVLGYNFLGEHFSPILSLLAPLHYIFPSPYLLIVLQPLALWSSVFFLQRILRDEGLSTEVTNIACLIYLNNPVMISTLNYLFHMESFLPLILLGMFQAYRSKSNARYWIFFILALMVKEDVGFYMFGFSIYVMIADRRYMTGLPGAMLSLLWVLFVLKVGIPYFGGEAQYKYFARWGSWGGGPLGIALGFIGHPLKFIGKLMADPYLKLFGGLLFLPFFGRWIWIMLGIPWIITATGITQQAHLSLYYGMPLFAFTVIAAALGLKTNGFRKVMSRRYAPALVALVIVVNVAHLRYLAIPSNRDKILNTLAAIPSDAAVQTMSCFYPEMGYERAKSVIWPDDKPTADYIVFSTDFKPWPLSKSDVANLEVLCSSSGRYDDISRVNGLFVFKKRTQ